MTDELASNIIELLADRPLTRGELAKLARVDFGTIDKKLEELEKAGWVYQAGWRWFVSSKVIVHHAFWEAFHRDEFPDGEFGKFLREFGAARRLGATNEEAWKLAKMRVGGV